MISTAFRPNIGNIHRRRSKRTRYPALGISTAAGVNGLTVSRCWEYPPPGSVISRGSPHPVGAARRRRTGNARSPGSPRAPGRCHETTGMTGFATTGQSHQHPVNVAIHKVACQASTILHPGTALVPARRPCRVPQLGWAGAIPVLVFTGGCR